MRIVSRFVRLCRFNCVISQSRIAPRGVRQTRGTPRDLSSRIVHHQRIIIYRGFSIKGVPNNYEAGNLKCNFGVIFERARVSDAISEEKMSCFFSEYFVRFACTEKAFNVKQLNGKS